MVETLKMPEVDEEKTFTFNSAELKFFILEIKDMIIEGKELDAGKAVRNAKYLAEMERRVKDIESGKNVISFTEEEWEKFIDEKTFS